MTPQHAIQCNEAQNLVQALGRRHGSLDDKTSNVLPALLKKRDKVVDGKHDVGDQLVLGHANVADGNTQAENLLKLELDGGLDFGDLGVHVLSVGERSREFTSPGKTGSQDTGDLLDQGVGSNESIVLAGELLDELLVLVELLQVVDGSRLQAQVLGTIEIVLVTNDANAHTRARNVGKADGAGETLVTLRVIVLQTDLELDGLEEVTLLGVLGVVQKLLDILTHSGDCDLRHDGDSLPEELSVLMVWLCVKSRSGSRFQQ
jgi:hypothetical protein